MEHTQGQREGRQNERVGVMETTETKGGREGGRKEGSTEGRKEETKECKEERFNRRE